MDLALNNLQRLIYHKTHQTKPNQTKPLFRQSKFSISFFIIKNPKQRKTTETKVNYGKTAPNYNIINCKFQYLYQFNKS